MGMGMGIGIGIGIGIKRGSGEENLLDVRGVFESPKCLYRLDIVRRAGYCFLSRVGGVPTSFIHNNDVQ